MLLVFYSINTEIQNSVNLVLSKNNRTAALSKKQRAASKLVVFLALASSSTVSSKEVFCP